MTTDRLALADKRRSYARYSPGGTARHGHVVAANVNLTPFQDRFAGSQVRVERTLGEQRLQVFGRGPGRTDIAKHVAIEQPYINVGRFETTRGCLGDNVECSFGLRRRTGNGAQDVGTRGLIFKRLAQLIEQPRVLDCDDGLGSEIRYQLDLLVREEANFLTKDNDGSNEVIVLKHRHSEARSNATKLDGVDDRWIALGISCVAAVSAIWTVCLVLISLPKALLGAGRKGPRLRASTNADGALCAATMRRASPS